MDLGIRNRRAIVTGGSGIGYETARQFLEEGPDRDLRAYRVSAFRPLAIQASAMVLSLSAFLST